MNHAILEFMIWATGPNLSLTVSFDGYEIYDSIDVPLRPTMITHRFDDQISGSHELEFRMAGKHINHTLIDNDGKILEDRIVLIQDIKIQNIELGYTFSQISEYNHDNNGNGPSTVDKFFGSMGCNGSVKFRFYSPVYLWLLDNLS